MISESNLFYRFYLNKIALASSCGRSTIKGEFIHPKRIINEFVIFLGVGDNFYFQENDTPLTLRHDETLFLRPNQKHGSPKTSMNVEYHWCHFHFEDEIEVISYEEAIEQLTLMQSKTLTNKDYLIIIPRHLELTESARVYTIFQQLFYSKRDGACYSEEYANHCLAMLLYELCQQTILYYCKKERLENSDFHFAQILRWINSNLFRYVSVVELAETFNYSPNYLCNLFRRKTGYSTREYINRRKIEEASFLLVQSDLTLKEIADACGFSDYKYFLKVFKQITNQTPTHLRNAWLISAKHDG